MKKEELLSIGLTEEQAEKVFAMNGRDIEKHKKAAEDAKADKAAVEKQLEDRNKDIEELKKTSGDADSIRKQLEELQGKYDKETESYKEQLAARDYDSAIAKAVSDNGVKFSSKSAEKAFLADLKAQKLEVKDGALDGFDKFLEKAKSDDPSAFVKGRGVDQQGPLTGGPRENKPTTLAGALHEKYDT